ncbi:TonB-dependent receptor [Sabulilitoribacter arenilitoris]|uniref:TonB-dependent receptor n=1 Tax=Wocania arenilitoris TaxID=2044858 RepID=A0AAE3JL34_9FLAO|nr:TonB-dependent receptor [Wocania arenilitoris]MCF7568808.1 TonB-dependent receptor [Wocania arenilitoris]
MKIKLTNARFININRLLKTIMRTFIFLFCSFIFASIPNNVISQNSKVKIKEDKVLTVDEVFDLIMDQTDYKFFYEEGTFKGYAKVNLKKGILKTSKLLKRSLSQGDFEVTLTSNNNILIKERQSVKKNIQKFEVSGTVQDANGQPLPGANITEKGTANGTQTDFDGKFSIEVTDKDAVLVVSYLGFKTKEIEVSNQTQISVILQEDVASLDEVVVVGYGSVKKSDLTSAIATVKGEDLENRVITRLDQALEGQLSGVTVQQASGIPGAAPRITVRGVGSINAGNNPLYVIDGFPVENASLMANINASDIQSIEVLKDAASAAIYGSRGANGVVLITTKKGVSGKTKFTFDTFYGVQSPEKLLKFMNASEQGLMETEVRNRLWVEAGGNASDPNDVRPPNRRVDPEWISGNFPNYDKNDYLFSKSAPIKNYTLTASGGNDRSKYFMSINYLDQEGITRNTEFNRIAIRTNLETKVFDDKLKIGLNLNPSRSFYSSNGAEGKDSNTNWMLWAGPLVKTDEFYYDYETNQIKNDYSAYYNMHPAIGPRFMIIDNIKPTREHVQVVANSFIELNILDGLNFKTSGGILYGFDKSKTFVGLIPGQGNISRSLSSSIGKNWLWENTLNYAKTIDKHSFNVLAGYSSQKVYSESFNISGRGYDNELSETLNNATDIYGWGESASEWSMISMFGRLTYNFDSRYLFTAAIRRDASSRFGASNKWGVFPSLSAAWNLHKENFLKDSELISSLKLRYSWGETGNNRIGNYASIAGVSASNAVLGVDESIVSGYRTSGLGNPDLGWEKTEATNVGLDIGFWNDRLSLTAEYYNNKTNDLLFNVPIPLVTGFGGQLKNLGSVRNKGFEFDISSRNIINGPFKWNTRLNFYTNKNEVLKVGPEGAPIITGNGFTNASYTGIGHPIGAFYMHKQIGIFQNQAEVDASATWGTQIPGDVKLADINNDGTIDNDDRTFVGQPQPKYNFGITNEFTYKNFDLSIFINGAGGNKVFFAQGRYYDKGFTPLGLGLAMTANWNNRWRSEQEPGDGKTPGIFNGFRGANGDFATTRWLHDGDFWRIKNISLGYTLPKNITESMKLQKLRLYVTGDNLFLKTDYIGYNPEVNISSGDNYLVSGYDYGSTPLARKIIFGLNVTF